MEKKKYKIKNKAPANDILPPVSSNVATGTQNLKNIKMLETVSELDSYPELSKAETLDFAEAVDSTP